MRLQIAHQGAVAVLTLDRPEARNALDAETVAMLNGALAEAADDPAIRVVLLQATGPVFSAGADLAGMQRMASASPAENLADARQLAGLLRALDTFPKPTIARVQGPAQGGAIGLIACCDIAIAAESADFGLSEVRLGLIPAVISPYLLRAIGARAARYLMLTGQRIPATEAHGLGLLHEVVPSAALDATVSKVIAACLAGGPQAQAAAKTLVAGLILPINDALIEDSAVRLAAIRTTGEAAEGLAAFLQKRSPKWVPGTGQ